MDLKWLEDFLSLAETRSFSRSAEARHVTQPAFSRRIRALETWLGVALIDRSTYPTELTPEGRRFHETADETVRMLQASRLDLQTGVRPNTRMVSIAALHTLALRFFPGWLRAIEAHTGPLSSRLLPDDFLACLEAFVDGSYDFLLTFHHPVVPIALEPALYPFRRVGADRLVAVRRAPNLRDAAADDDPLPLLAYAGTSFLGRLAAFAQSQPGAPAVRMTHVNENAMAEGLRFMVLDAHGVAWLPESLVAGDVADGTLLRVGPSIPMEIRLYRNVARARGVVDTVWSTAALVAAQTMPKPNEAV